MSRQEHIEDRRPCALAQIPGGLFVLTTQFENRRGALLVRWVQLCASEPPMVMVALPKGQAVEPLIHGSHSFALCQISADDRFLFRKFNHAQCTPERMSTHNGDAHSEDPLVTMMTTTAPSGSPIVDRAMTYLDCEVVRHIELDCDFRIYVGQVHSNGVLNQGTPAISFGGNGLAH